MKLAIIFELGLHMKKKKEIKHYIIACVLFGAATLLQHRSFYPILLYLFWVIMVTVIIYGEDLIKKIMVAIWSVGIIGSMDGFLYVFTQKLFTNHIIQVLSASVMTIIILYGLFKGFGKRHQYVLQNVQVKYFVYIAAVNIVNQPVMAIAVNYMRQEEKWKVLLLITFVMASWVFQMMFILQLASVNKVLEEKEAMMQEALKEQEKNYLYLEQQEEKIRKFRHDIRRHLYVIQELAQQKRYEEQKEYLETMIGKVEKPKNYITVGNGLLDAILIKYVMECEEKGIEFQIQGRMPVPCEIDSYDLCVIFTNLLSNAVEAVEEKSENRKISLCIGEYKGKILIEQKNSYEGYLNVVNERLETTKGNKEYHGYGLKNIEESVKKYQGNVIWSLKNQVFTMQINMLNKEQMNSRNLE